MEEFNLFHEVISPQQKANQKITNQHCHQLKIEYIRGGSRIEQNEIRSSPKALKRPSFGKFFCVAGKILNNRHKRRFFGARSPSKLVYFRAKGAIRKILGSVIKYRYLKIVQRGPFGSTGGRIPEGGGGVPPVISPLEYIKFHQSILN